MKIKIKNFVSGMGSIFDLYPSDTNDKLDLVPSVDTDREAIQKDWEAVGSDLLNAAGKQEDDRTK